MFALPVISADVLAQFCPENSSQDVTTSKVSSLLTASPMGWSWSLYFCQALVASQALTAGIPEER
eukprot:7505180-Pyramimonas_sp.AAC.1